MIKSLNFESTRGEDSFYWISIGGEPSTIQNAIFGDGGNLLLGSSGGAVTMVDRDSGEQWELDLRLGDQVYVDSDRSVRRLERFVSIDEEKEIVFRTTEDEALLRVIRYYQKQKDEYGQ